MTQMPLLFNPSRASFEELEATLVARLPLLEKLENDLLADGRKKTRRHWQLIGPRGSGKSHFTELLGRRLARNHGWVVARLPEEHYQISSVGELLEQIVLRLEGASQSPFAEIKRDSDLEDLALDRIRQWQYKHQKSIIVILENLGMLFERQLRDRRSQSRLREILTRDTPFVLLGTATSYADATVRHSAPFYDFFQVLTLEDLSSDEVAELVEARARWDMDEILLARLEVVRARVHAVFHFSGGNPRLVLALYSILKQGLTDDLHTQLIKLLDEVTPYYQQRLAGISPQMGRVLVRMALATDSATPADVARQCRIPINHATANVAKLVAERFVRPVGRPDKRRRFYGVNDRLFRLWMQMREDHMIRQRLSFLSEFFQHWYEGHPDEIGGTTDRIAEVSLMEHWIGRNKESDNHTIYHLLLGLLAAANDTSSSFVDILEWIITRVPQSQLQRAFVEWMPDLARRDRGRTGAILRVYKALRDRGALPVDLVPYSSALEVSEKPERSAAFSPELREAVALFNGTPNDVAERRSRTGSSPRSPLLQTAVSSRSASRRSRRRSSSVKPSTA